MAIAEISAKSLSEYVEAINSIKGSSRTLWFRGHPDSSYKLAPSIYRPPFTWEAERKFMNEFKSKAIRFIDVPTDDYWQWLFIMQHHGTPTRLLDWSENSITALAFATQYRDEKHQDKDATVWCLNPLTLNKLINFGHYDYEPIPSINEKSTLHNMYLDVSRTITPQFPIAIQGIRNNDRIIAQKGVFTLFPERDAYYLEEKLEAESFLAKISIKKEHTENIANELFFSGITETSLFPGIDSISKEIIRMYEPSGV